MHLHRCSLEDFHLVGDDTELGQGHFLSAGAWRVLVDGVPYVPVSSTPGIGALVRAGYSQPAHSLKKLALSLTEGISY